MSSRHRGDRYNLDDPLLVQYGKYIAGVLQGGTRMCDRLVREGLAGRYRTAGDRRAVRLTLTPAGRRLVDEVTTRRRTELARIVADMPDQQGTPVVTALRAFAIAAGEVPEQEWWLGWAHTDEDPAYSR